MNPTQRHERIRVLISEHEIRNQHDLQERLATEGILVTQATLSRDLRRLGVAKGPAGYVMPDRPGRGLLDTDDARRRLQRSLERELRTVDYGGTTVVLRTAPGHANALAIELDRVNLPDVVGTIAGDDTIFVAVRTAVAARDFTRELRTLARHARPAAAPIARRRRNA